MKVIRCTYRFILITLYLLSSSVMVCTILGRDPAHRNAKDWRFINSRMRRLRKILGLRVHISGQPAVSPALLTSNHISWHDIIVLQSLVPTGFVGKAEIRDWPLIGWLSYQGNTLFVRRGKRESFEQIHAAMAERFSDNQSITLFPEGTTTIGESVKHFRSRLLEPAINLRVPIQPVMIWYRSKNMSCRELAFVGDEGLGSHLFRTLGEPHIDVYVHFCDAIITSKDDDRREVGRQAQVQVAEQLAAIVEKNSI
ncbi:MAG: 1-acyl-sn-glycerol-3-phosphate acyltransferase [Gammaproteobacteria bacterium]|nr:1-acyl-sn-glycerol-3-phosphate acyltransferase [Gammaproteobacteria bacterium]